MSPLLVYLRFGARESAFRSKQSHSRSGRATSAFSNYSRIRMMLVGAVGIEPTTP
jgi:hypothetical protein